MIWGKSGLPIRIPRPKDSVVYRLPHRYSDNSDSRAFYLMFMAAVTLGLRTTYLLRQVFWRRQPV